MSGIPVIRGVGFDPYEDTHEEGADSRAAAEAQAEQDELDRAYLSTFSSRVGQSVLADMRKRVLTEPGFSPGLGLLNGIACGFAKEGVMAWMQDIENRMKRAGGL